MRIENDYNSLKEELIVFGFDVALDHCFNDEKFMMLS